MQDFSLIDSDARVLFSTETGQSPTTVSEIVDLSDGFSSTVNWVDAFTISKPHELKWDRKKAASVKGIGFSNTATLLIANVVVHERDTFEAIMGMSRSDFFSLAVVQLQDEQFVAAYAARAALDFCSISTSSSDPTPIGILIDSCRMIRG